MPSSAAPCWFGLAGLVGVPIGVLGGIYLAEFGSPRLNWAVRFAADILNGTPSIVWGIVVYALVVLPITGYSVYAAGLASSLRHDNYSFSDMKFEPLVNIT